LTVASLVELATDPNSSWFCRAGRRGRVRRRRPVTGPPMVPGSCTPSTSTPTTGAAAPAGTCSQPPRRSWTGWASPSRCCGSCPATPAPAASERAGWAADGTEKTSEALGSASKRSATGGAPSGCLPGGLPCPWTPGTVDAVARHQAPRDNRQSQRRRPSIKAAGRGRLGCRVGWWGARGWGSDRPAPSARSLHLGRGGRWSSHHLPLPSRTGYTHRFSRSTRPTHQAHTGGR
jgi:hypothetical protein